MSQGVTENYGITGFGTGYVHSASEKRSIELVTVMDSSGVTKCVIPKALVTIESNIKGAGDGGLGSMAAGVLSAVATMDVRSRKRTENNSEVAEFDISATGYDDLDYANVASAITATGDAGEAMEGAVACPVLGITSCGLTLVTSFDIEEKIEESEPVLNTDGTFARQNTYDPKFEFSVSGKGDLPASVLLGSDATLASTVSEFSAGVTMVTELEVTQDKEDEDTWSCSGTHFPGAA